MSSTAMIGSGQPTLRRVASISSTIMIVPITQSSVSGLPTRNWRSWKTQGTYRLETTAAIANSQSCRPMPRGRNSPARGGLALPALRVENTRKMRPSTKAMWMPRCVVSGSRPKPAV